MNRQVLLWTSALASVQHWRAEVAAEAHPLRRREIEGLGFASLLKQAEDYVHQRRPAEPDVRRKWAALRNALMKLQPKDAYDTTAADTQDRLCFWGAIPLVYEARREPFGHKLAV